jgi:hypothetical protein
MDGDVTLDDMSDCNNLVVRGTFHKTTCQLIPTHLLLLTRLMLLPVVSPLNEMVYLVSTLDLMTLAFQLRRCYLCGEGTCVALQCVIYVAGPRVMDNAMVALAPPPMV